MPTDPLPDDQTDALLDDEQADPLPEPARAPRNANRLLVAAGAGALLLALAGGWALGRQGAPLPSPSSPAIAQPTGPAEPAPSSDEVLPLPAVDTARKAQNRFTRADRDDDGFVQQSEYLAARRRNYEKLDANSNGTLEFAEYASTGIRKFSTADTDRSGALDSTEFASTAPVKRAKRKAPCTPAPAAEQE